MAIEESINIVQTASDPDRSNASPHCVQLETRTAKLSGTLSKPGSCEGVVVVARATESIESDHSNAVLRDGLHRSKLGCLVMNLIASQELRRKAYLQSDADVLADRICSVVRLLRKHSMTMNCSLGLYGAKIAGAAVMAACANCGEMISAAVVCDPASFPKSIYLEPHLPPICLIASAPGGDSHMLRKISARDFESADVSVLSKEKKGDRFELGAAVECEIAVEWFKDHLSHGTRGLSNKMMSC